MIKSRGILAAARRVERSAAGLRSLASGKALERPANRMRAVGARLLRNVFATSIQPDGSPMAPLVYREGKPLVLTRQLSSGARVIVVGVGRFGITLLFEVPDTPDVKAIWHQAGTFRGGPTSDPRRAQNRKSFRAGEAEKPHIPARKMLPENQAEAGPWLAELDRVGQEEIDKLLRSIGF